MVAYACYVIGAGVVIADVSGSYRPVIVRDELAPNQHYLSGMIMVDNTCDQLTLSTKAISDTNFELVFGTWREPSSAVCADDPSPRSFRALLFAPAAGVSFIATYNGRSLPIAVVTMTPSGRR